MSNYDPRKIPDSIFRLRMTIQHLEKRVESLETMVALLALWVLALSIALAIAFFV
ncbi:hypothetical protein [Picosynechococcus sp. PCC 8807]|uniref:hypothetical protein n=1 Tax=Picosynechococcus sp. PCC 8807 TaxID=195248 RepID=UPI0012ED50E0|nr:hypothetical protein [Picosynechococcus sp. PCC 8807]